LETSKEVHEVSRCSGRESVLAVGDYIRDAATGQIESDCHAFGIGVRIAIGNLGHSSGVRETHHHGHGLAEVRRATQFRSRRCWFKSAFAHDSFCVRQPETRVVSEGLKKKVGGLLGQLCVVRLSSAICRHKNSWWRLSVTAESRFTFMIAPVGVLKKFHRVKGQRESVATHHFADVAQQ
jgi:hypothetical protein